MASTNTTDHGEKTDIISSVHCDIVKHAILSRLDGLSLASLSCTSSYFNMLSSEDSTWRKICTSTWPSLSHPRVHRLISVVPNGYTRLFSSSFPLLTPHSEVRRTRNCSASSLPSELISAVDIRYQDKVILSRVFESETESDCFLQSRFRVDLLNSEEVHPSTRVKLGRGDDTRVTLSELEENLTLSWIIFDPVTLKSANLSSIKPVSFERRWNPGEYDIEYVTILNSERVGHVECKVVVTCGGLEHGELHVSEACLRVKDMDEKYLNGKESVECLVNAIEFGKRVQRRSGEEGKNMREEYLRAKRLRWDKRVSMLRVLGFLCGGGLGVSLGVVGVGVSIGAVVFTVVSSFYHIAK